MSILSLTVMDRFTTLAETFLVNIETSITIDKIRGRRKILATLVYYFSVNWT